MSNYEYALFFTFVVGCIFAIDNYMLRLKVNRIEKNAKLLSSNTDIVKQVLNPMAKEIDKNLDKFSEALEEVAGLVDDKFFQVDKNIYEVYKTINDNAEAITNNAKVLAEIYNYNELEYDKNKQIKLKSGKLTDLSTCEKQLKAYEKELKKYSKK